MRMQLHMSPQTLAVLHAVRMGVLRQRHAAGLGTASPALKAHRLKLLSLMRKHKLRKQSGGALM